MKAKIVMESIGTRSLTGAAVAPAEAEEILGAILEVEDKERKKSFRLLLPCGETSQKELEDFCQLLRAMVSSLRDKA